MTKYRNIKKPDPLKFKKGNKYIDRLTSQATFEPFTKTSARGNEIIRPKRPGETITGIICEPVSNFHDSTSYPIVLDDKKIVELPGNKVLHRLVKIADCLFQRVTITYRGRQYLKNGHYRKIYSIKPAPL